MRMKGVLWLVMFGIWTVLIRMVDVQCAGETGTAIGFATFNIGFHRLTGVHMEIYTATDWLGLIPIFVCILFACIGVLQLITRRSLWKVDHDILLLGGYYVIVIGCYLLFEMIPVNYRPILIEGRMEASYPSSTTLLVLSVMPTLNVQIMHRWKHMRGMRVLRFLTTLFSLGMVIGRLVSGVHWLTDIVGAVFLSAGLFEVYQAAVRWYCKEEF